MNSRCLLALSLATALLAGCGRGVADAVKADLSGSTIASSWWGFKSSPRASQQEGPIPTQLTTPFLKDPSLVDGGRPVAGQRYLAFGDLRGFYLKAFEVDGRGGPLRFASVETPLHITGLAARLDSPWAPQLRVVGDRLELYYTAGEMPPPDGPHWPSFRLHRASMAVVDFAKAMAAGQPPAFTEQGEILSDLAPFGSGDGDFGVIDPCLYVSPKGRTFMTYTVVREGIAGKRPHEELVRYREVDPHDVGRPLAADQRMYDGKSGSPDDGVAEAQDVVSLHGHTYAFISSRAGDIDQRVLVAPVGDNLGRLAPALSVCLAPGRDPWQAKAVGSSSAAELGSACYMVYQGLGAAGRFGLGWTTLAL